MHSGNQHDDIQKKNGSQELVENVNDYLFAIGFHMLWERKWLRIFIKKITCNVNRIVHLQIYKMILMQIFLTGFINAFSLWKDKEPVCMPIILHYIFNWIEVPSALKIIDARLLDRLFAGEWVQFTITLNHIFISGLQ